LPKQTLTEMVASLREDRLGRLATFLLVSTALLSGCAAVPGHPPWGSRVDFTPGWNKLGRSAVAALKDPLTWGPAAGALAFSFGDLDREVSDWAREEQPLFGDEADRTGDWLLGSISGLYLGSAVLADSGNGSAWQSSKARGLGLGLSTNLAAGGITYGLKETVQRSRPDASDRQSFPSGHSSLAAANAVLFADNLNSLPLSPPNRIILAGAGYGLAWGTAWSRIEAGKHYPSDVLAGLALGHFVARVLQHGLLSDSQNITTLDLQMDRDLLLVSLRYDY